MQGSRLTTESERDALARKIKNRMNTFCSTPGRKIRSKGKGRGLGSGKGRGPLGIPFGYK